MGRNVANVEIITDYSLNEHAMRLHIDLPISRAQLNKLRDHMDHGFVEQAFEVMQLNCEPKHHPILEEFKKALVGIYKENNNAVI